MPRASPSAEMALSISASVVLPYFGVWALAATVQPSPWLALALGLVGTVFLVRMYSFFHDLTHNSMFRSRRANRFWGYLLGFLLFQRQFMQSFMQAGIK